MVHALARAGGGAKLPSVGLCLNASKAVSFLDKGGNDTSRSSVGRKAQNNVTLLGDRRSRRPSHEPLLVVEVTNRRRDRSLPRPARLSDDRSWVSFCFDVGTRNCLQTTYVPGRVLCSVEQFPRCDLLRLSPSLGDSSRCARRDPGRGVAPDRASVPTRGSRTGVDVAAFFLCPL